MVARFGGHGALLFVGLATFVLMGAVQALFGPSLPAMGRAFALAPAQTAWLISVQSAGSALGIGAMFLWSQRGTPRLALAAMAAGTAGMAAMAGWLPVLAGGAIFGLGYGLAAAVFNPRVLAAFGTRGPSMLSLLNAVFGVGAILSPLIFVGLGSDPRLAFGLAAVLFVLVCLFAGRAATSTAPGQDGKGVGSLRIRRDILAFGCIGIGLEASLIGLGPMALIAAGVAETRAAELLSAFFLAFVASRGFLVLIADRVPSFGIYVLAMALTMVGAAGAILLPPGAFFILIGGAAGLYFPGFFVTASRLMGNHPRAAPVILSAGLVGAITMPLALGWAMGKLGERGFFWIVLVLSGLALAGGLLAWRRMR